MGKERKERRENLPLNIIKCGKRDPSLQQCGLILHHILFRNILHTQKENKKRPQFVFGLPFGVINRLQDLGFRLSPNVLLELEPIVELSVFNAIQKGRGDIHVHVQRGFAGGEFRDCGDGGFKMLCVGGYVAKNNLNRGFGGFG